MAYSTDSRTLYVGNLHKNVTEALLYELFLQAGPVERVSIPKSNSVSFRYGFVTYVHECAIDYAIELYKGTLLYDKKLVIKKKGEKRQEPKSSSNAYGKESANKQDKNTDNPAELEQLYVPKYGHQKNEPGSNLTRAQMESLMDLGYKGLKGPWSERYKPYDHNSRRQNTSRPVNFNKRDRRRNRSHYNKSHREKKGGRF